MGQNNQKPRLKYWATRSSVHSFACKAHSFACSTLLVLLARSAALIRFLARSLRSVPCSWDSEWLDCFLFRVFFSILDHSAFLFYSLRYFCLWQLRYCALWVTPLSLRLSLPALSFLRSFEMRLRISMKGRVRRSVRPLVRWSILQSVTHILRNKISCPNLNKTALRNMKLDHLILKDDSVHEQITSTHSIRIE